MQYRELSRTGLKVSDIGYGAWGIGGAGGGWVGAEDDESILALETFIGLGGTFIDTARGYGRSEELVGRVVRAHDGEGLIVATKVPPRNGEWPARQGVPVEEAFPGEHIRSSLETSLRASGLDAFDVLQFHVWSDDWVGRGDWLETIQALKDEGKIRHFGVSINDHQPENALELIRSGAVETVQVIYNVFHQQPEEQLLPACQEHGVGVIVRVALDEGGLTGRITAETRFEDGDFRARYFGGNRPAEVQRYEEALGAVPAAEQAAPEGTGPPPPRSRLPLVLGVAVPVAIAVGAVGVAVLGGIAPATAPTPPASSRALGSAMHAVTEVRSPAGGAQEFRGLGSGIAAVAAAELPQADRLELILTLGATGPVHWAAQRVEIHLDGDQYVRVLSEERRTQTGGVPVGYLLRGTSPTSVRVDVGEGVPWSLVVVPRA